MKLIDSIKILQEQGVEIKYFHRKDGGYIVTKIGGVSYKGAAGNAVVRQLTGATLSEAKQAQLKSITTTGQRKKAPIPQSLKKEVAKLQRKWKKVSRPKGEIKLQKFRERYGELGYEETIRSIEQLHRYAEGLAYDAVIDALIEAIRNAGNKSGDATYFEIINDIQSVRATIKDEWIPMIYEVLYEVNEKVITVQEARNQIQRIIGI